MSDKQDAIALNAPPLLEAIRKPQAVNLTRLAAFVPSSLTEAVALAKLIASSDLAPREYRGKPGNVLIGMQYAAELGVPLLIGLQNISIINGHASVWGDLALGIVQTHPAYESHKEWMEGSGETRKAFFQIKRKGHELHQQTFSVQDAKTAKLWQKRGYNGQDTPWITNPDRMLQMRARGFGLRDKFADALKGLILAEEAMDLPIAPSAAEKERQTFDVTNLTPSPEPNRGHEDTGLAKNGGSPKLDEQKQSPAKEVPAMCADCGKIGGHAPECKYAAKSEQDRLTSPTTRKAVYLLKKAEQKKKKNGEPYLALSVVNGENVDGKLYVWRQSLFEYLIGKKEVVMMGEVSQQEAKDGKVFFQLDHLLEIGGRQLLNDKLVDVTSEMTIADEATENLFSEEA